MRTGSLMYSQYLLLPLKYGYTWFAIEGSANITAHKADWRLK